MLRNCRGAQRSRLLSKFSENDHEKVDRLLELHFKYMEKVDVIDIELENRVSIFVICHFYSEISKFYGLFSY